MKRFDFPLERVLRWRQEQAALEELKLQQLHAEMTRLVAAQHKMQADAAESHQYVFQGARVDSLILESLDSYREYTAGQIRNLQVRQRQWEAKIAEQLRRVMEARRRSELFERLRQDALQRWRAAANKEQEDLAAELFLAKRRRKLLT